MKLSTVIEKVENYKRKNDTSPLHFKDFKYTPRFLKRLTLENKIKKIIELSQLYHSANPEGEIETPNGRFRSSIDIWRHIIYNCPEVTLLEVMQAMYDMGRALSSHFCGYVHRRVFWKSHDWNIIFGRHGDISYRDEYGLILSQWNIRELETE